MRWAWLAALLASGCYGVHDRPDALAPDAGVSPLAGRWLVDRPPSSAETVYALEPGGRLLTACGAPGTATVVRTEDGLGCAFTGPWWSRVPSELAVDCFGDDSVARTVVLRVTVAPGAAATVALDKVDGDSSGWTVGEPPWRWRSCADFPDACAAVCR